MDKSEADRPGVKSTHTVFAIIELLIQEDGATVSEIAEQLDLAKSSVHDHLKSLYAQEIIVQDDNEYRLGFKFLEIGSKVKARHELSTLAKPKLEQLAEDTNEATWLIIEEHGRAVYAQKIVEEQALQVEVPLGKRAHLHTTAAGKAILAYLPHKRIDEIVERHGLPKKTDNTITDRETLQNHLEQIRQQGYALNEGEQIPGVRAVGAPILYDGEVCGAISVTGAEYRFKGDRFHSDLPDRTKAIANEIEVQMSYQSLDSE
jgi:DNA-binding IclR family transcriptional regulator